MSHPGMVLLDPYWRALPDDEQLHRRGSRKADVPTFSLGDIRALVVRVDAMGEPPSCPPERVRELADRLMGADWDRWLARLRLMAIGKYRHVDSSIPYYPDRATTCIHTALTMETLGLVDVAFEALEWADHSEVQP